MTKVPSRGRRTRTALVWAAIVSFLMGLLLFAWRQMATPALIEISDALNVSAVVFWLTFGVFYLIHIRRSDDDVNAERSAAIAEAWMDRRRLSLLRGRSQRR